MGDRVHKKERVYILRAMPDGFTTALWRQARWDFDVDQWLTRDEVAELRVLWQLTQSVDVVCRRLAEMNGGQVWTVIGSGAAYVMGTGKAMKARV